MLVVPVAMAIGTRIRGVFGVRHLDSDPASQSNMAVLFERFPGVTVELQLAERSGAPDREYINQARRESHGITRRRAQSSPAKQSTPDIDSPSCQVGCPSETLK